MSWRLAPAAALAVLLLGSPAALAGILDDVKGAVGDARKLVGDVKETRDEAKDTVGEARDVVDETAEDVGSAVPERGTGPAPPPPSAVPAPPSARRWQLDLGGGQTREVSEAELVQMIRAGRVGPDQFVYGRSLAEWTPAREVPALARYFRD